jgi:5-(aminomethyl)-3-furanmethanol phosphate kinase
MTAPVVLKFGGSLLTIPDLMKRLEAVIDRLRPSPVLIVPGGGAAANIIRNLDQKLRLAPEKAHRDAIAAMSHNATLLCRLNKSLRLVRNHGEAQRVWSEGHSAVLDADSFLFGQPENNTGDSLPASWEITSDSIAAWTARQWQADRIILAKSCDAPETNLSALCQLGMIDRAFATIVGHVRTEWLNLRSSSISFVSISE